MRYAAHQRLTAPAAPSRALWRLVLGIVVAGAVMFGISRAFFAVLHMVLSEDRYWDLWADIQGGTTATGVLLLLVLMGAMGVATIMTAQLVHRRSAGSLFGPAAAFRAQFFRVLVALIVLYAVLGALPPWPKIPNPQPGLAPSLWLALLPLTLVALTIQTGSEELFFRGYLQSQLAARFRHPVIWITVPSALFAIGHYAPDLYGANAGLVTLWAFAFGVVAADLTARAGTLGPACALHLANNFMAIAVTSLPGEMSGLALTQLPFGANDTEALRAILPLDLATLGVSWLAARLALRR